MRVAIYARVSTAAQEARGTIGSQLTLLRERVAREGHELVAEYTDDGLSGARLDRPGLDALRDAAEAGQIEGVWCLSADRLARMYAYQVIVLDELSRHGVTVRFHDTPQIEDDPQARLLTQVQGVIAEYERTKIAERYRRGKLWRARVGEEIAWKVPYGYRHRRPTRTTIVATSLPVDPSMGICPCRFPRRWCQASRHRADLVPSLNPLDHCAPLVRRLRPWSRATHDPLARPSRHRPRSVADNYDLSSADNASTSCRTPMVASGVRFIAVPGDDRRCPRSTRLTSLSPYDLSRSASDTADARARCRQSMSPHRFWHRRSRVPFRLAPAPTDRRKRFRSPHSCLVLKAGA